jgi:hypothetical protein
MNDGTPAFYNSNILGRYMRKDYFKTGTDSWRSLSSLL